MPRPKISVKVKLNHSVITPAPIDLHFHGALGVDFMQADFNGAQDGDFLARELARRGLGGFLATTLSSSRPDLLAAVTRLGQWIKTTRAHRDSSLALPLGIHLEGPFISKLACGAHPHASLRKATLAELEALWTASQGSLRLITVAPEIHSPAILRAVCGWTRRHGIRLAIGHSHATSKQTEAALKLGFSGVTHAWNAMPFHHRLPGILGAVLGRPNTHLELILDGIHVAPDVIRWTRDLHGPATCYVSDCAPAAGLRPGVKATFGPLFVQVAGGGCRLPEGHLAGGAILLPEALRAWIEMECRRTDQPWRNIVRFEAHYATRAPLQAIGLSLSVLRSRKLVWRRASQSVDFAVVRS